MVQDQDIDRQADISDPKLASIMVDAAKPLPPLPLPPHPQVITIFNNEGYCTIIALYSQDEKRNNKIDKAFLIPYRSLPRVIE